MIGHPLLQSLSRNRTTRMGDRAQNPSSSNFQSINPNDPRLQLQRGAVQRPAPGNISQYPLPPYSPVSMMNPLYPYGTSFLNFPVPTQPGTTFETFQFQGPQSYRVAPQPHGQSINPGIGFQQQQPCGPPNPPPMITRHPPPNVGRQHATSSTSRPPPSKTSKNLTTTGQISPSGVPSSYPASGDHDCCNSTRSVGDLNPVNLTPQASTSTANNHTTAPSSARLPPGSGEARPLRNTNTAPQHLSFSPNVSVTCSLGTPSGSSTFVMPDRLPSPPGWKSNPFRDAEEAHAAWGEIAERNDRSINLKTRSADPLHSQIVGTSELPVNKGETSVGTGLGRVQNDTLNVTMPHSAPEDIEKPTRSENERPKLEVTPKSQHSTLPNVGSGSRRPTPNPIVESNNMINLPRRSQSVCDDSTAIGDRAAEQRSELGSWTSLLPNVKVMPSPIRHRILYQGYKEEIQGQVKEEVKEVKDEEYPDGLVGPARGSATVTPMKRSPSLHDLWVEGEQERSTTGECQPPKRRRLDEVSGAPGDGSENVSGNETLFLHPTARGHSNPTISQGTTEAHDPAETSTTALGSTNPVVLTNPPVHVSPQGIVVSPYAKIPFTSFSSSRRPLSGAAVNTSIQNNRKRAASADADHVDSGRKRARVDSPGPGLYSSNAVDEQGISAMMPTQGYCSHPPNDHVVKAITTDTHATPPSSPLQGDSRGVGTDAPHTPHTPSPIHDSASVPQPEKCDNSEVLPARLSPQPPIQREPQGPSFSDTPNPPETSPAADARRKSDYSPQGKRNRMDRRRQANTNSDATDQQGVQGRSGSLNSNTLQRKQPNDHSARVPEWPYARLGGSVDSDSAHRGAEQRAVRPYPWKFGDNHWHPPDEDEDPRNGRTSSPSPVSRTQRRNVDGWGPSERSRSRSPNYHHPRHENQWSPRRDGRDWDTEHPRPRSPPWRRYPDDLRTYRTGGDSYRPPPSAHTTIRLTPPPLPYEPFQHIRDRGQPYPPCDSGSGSHFQALPLGPASPTNTSFQRTTSPGGTVWAILPRSPPDPHGGEHKFRGGPTGASSLSGTGPDSGGTNPAGTLSGFAVSTTLEVPRNLVGRAYNNTDRPHRPPAGAAQSNEKMTTDVRSPFTNHVQPNASQPSNTAPDSVSRPLHSDTSFVHPSKRSVVSSSREDDTNPASSRPLAARLSSTGPERATRNATEEPRPSLLSRVGVSSPTEGNHVPIARGRTREGQPPPPRSSLRDRIHTEPTNFDRGRLAERVNPLAPYYGAVGSRASDSYGTPTSQSTHLLNRLEAPRPGRGSSYRGNRARGRGRGVWNREA